MAQLFATEIYTTIWTLPINALLKDIDRNGYTGIGKPEPLKYELSGFWSRRIDDTHRLVYRISGDAVEIAQCRTHYSG